MSESEQQTDTMKFFQLTQKYYRTLGMYSTKPNETYTFNWRSFMILAWMLMAFLATAAYFLFKTHIDINYSETVQSFYFASTQFNFLFCFAINLWKVPKSYELIEILDELVNKSKRTITHFTSYNLN